MLIANSSAPRALMAAGLPSVRAEGGRPSLEARAVSELTEAINDFKAKFEGRLQALEKHGDEQALKLAAYQLNGGPSEQSDGQANDPEYRQAFASYARRGAMDAEATLRDANADGTDRGRIRAAMSEGDNSAGGYMAPVEWDRRVRKAQRSFSPMRRLAQIVTTGVNGYSTLWNSEQWGSGWVGETASRPQTSTTTLTPLNFPAGEIYAMPAATQRLIDDALLDFEQWLSNELSDEFSRQEGIAFISGDGVNKPLGFLQYLPGGVAATGQPLAHPGGELGVTVSGAAAALTPDGLVDLKYGLGAPYRQGAAWLMNSMTAALITKMKDGDGNFLWRESLAVEQPPLLLGSPVEIDEAMPNVGADAFPIAFGDFSRGYLINDRIGVRILRDPFTAKPYVLFYATKRVGGGVLDPKAIRVQKVSAG
ncbi:Phage capsid family protein [Sphingomonas haloaromaticamans]|uniref:Phage capsid family protein n=1 Tax=Edaphosphingomonas haloaromaticamans TaxID=653954 RepID=A0A1S1HIW3_9SPHN|nr:phage major capsid protein [Sphingomonas haloaromaticamans]OHT22185.1 Phage capsid family protein [Sphingomonas haloaromaticamans]